MDFLNKAIAQLKDLLASMTPGARITSGLLLATVVVGLMYVCRGPSSGSDVDLMNGEPVAASQLRAMEAAFGKANLTGYEIRGSTIRVPRGQQAAYMAALVEAKALPAEFGQRLQAAGASSSPFMSEAQRKTQMIIARQEELALMIRTMPGIENASVIYDTKKKGGLSPDDISTATVGVKPLGSNQLDERRVPSIRDAVAGGFAGLKRENVNVVDLNAGKVYHGESESGAGGGENLCLAVRQMYEKEYKDKVLSALSYIPGLTAEASVVLGREPRMLKVKLGHNPNDISVPIKEAGGTAPGQSEDGPAGASGEQRSTPGNAPVGVAATPGKEPQNPPETVDHDGVGAACNNREEDAAAGLTPRQVKISVGIPSSYFEKVWRERNPAREGEGPKMPDQAALDQIRTEESANIQKHVAALLPSEPGANAAELVTITTFQDIKTEATTEATIAERAAAWLGQHGSALGLAGLGLLVLFMLRSTVLRGAPAATESVSMPTRHAPSAGPRPRPATAAETAASGRARRLSGSGPALRDELSELVRNDPRAAAEILRGWIGNAG